MSLANFCKKQLDKIAKASVDKMGDISSESFCIFPILLVKWRKCRRRYAGEFFESVGKGV